MTTDTITILRSFGTPQAKVLSKAGCKSNARSLYFSGQEIEVEGIESLTAVLEAVSADPMKSVVRGRIVENVDRSRMLRRSKPRPGEPATLLEVPRRWLMLDIDDLAAPAGVDPLEATAAAAEVKRRIPKAFSDASCWYQFTASAGLKRGIRLRLAFWLNRPLGAAELKRWLGTEVPTIDGTAVQLYPIDLSLFHPAQIHFTAHPILTEGFADPLAGRDRSGFLRGAIDVVPVPAIPRQNPPASTRPARDAGSGASTGQSFMACLSEIGDQSGGSGFYRPMTRAISLWWFEHGAAADPTEMIVSLETRMRSADRHKHTLAEVEDRVAEIPGMCNAIRQSQLAREIQKKEEFENAACRFPDEGTSLSEGEARLGSALDDFFSVSLTLGRRQRDEYDGAERDARKEAEARQQGLAEIEFGGAGDTDHFFSDEPVSSPDFDQHGIRVTAGAGKTRAAIERAVKAIGEGYRIVVATPTHSKCEENAALANNISCETTGRRFAEIWRGLDREDPDAPGENMCRRAPVMREVLAAGAKADALCGSKGGGFCPHHPASGGACGYRAQMVRKPPLCFVPTQLLASPIPRALESADALIIDEQINLGDASVALPLSWLTEARDFETDRAAANASIKALVEKVGPAIELTQPGGFLLRDTFTRLNIAACDCRDAASRERWGFASPSQSLSTADDAAVVAESKKVGEQNEKVVARCAFWNQLAAFLESEDEASARLCLSANGEEIQIAQPRLIHPSWLIRPVLHLDATLEETVVRPFLPRLELKADIRVARGEGVRVRQVTDQPVTYSKVVPGAASGDGGAQINKVRAIARRIEVAAFEERRKHSDRGQVACVMPKKTEEWIAENIPRLAGLGNVRLAHFGALRGLNALEEVTRLIVVSRPEPSPENVEGNVRRLFDRHPDPCLTSGMYPRRPTLLRTATGCREVVEESYHPDPLCDAVLRQVRDAELEQAIHRARIVRRSTEVPLQVDIITSTPVDVTVDGTMSFSEWLGEASPAHLLLSRGFWPNHWAGKYRVLSDLYPTPHAVRRAFEECAPAAQIRAWWGGDSSKPAQTPYDNSLIRGLGTFDWPRYRYRLSGHRRSQMISVDPALHDDPCAAWGRCFGARLDFFETVAPSPPRRPKTPPVLVGALLTKNPVDVAAPADGGAMRHAA